MAKFGTVSRGRSETCHPDLQLIFNTVILIYDHSIICGRRGEEAQNKAFNEGRSQLRYPNSYHNKMPSMALDAMPYFADSPYHIHWDDIESCKILAGLVKAVAEMLYAQGKITHKIIWGGDWKNFKDYPHYQLVKINGN